MTRRGQAENGLPAYLDSLSAEKQQRFLALAATVAAVPEPARIDAFVFHPNQQYHSRWDDAAAVFWQAVASLYLSQPLAARELPVLYWGFHSYSLLARRSVNGVLLTDRGLYVVDAARDSWAMPLETVLPATISADDTVLRVGAASIDLPVAKRLFAPGDAAASAGYLARVLAALQQTLGVQPFAPPEGTAEQLIAASSFSRDFQLPSRAGDAKKVAKLVTNWELPTDEPVLFALSSATFAGVYGLAVTELDVYSRDLMEPLERSSRLDLDPASFGWTEEKSGFRIAADHVVPNHPAIRATRRDEFVNLLRHVLKP